MKTIEDGLVYDEEGRVLLAGYVPTLWASCVALVLYFALTVVFFVNWHRSGRQRYMLWILTGAVAMVTGFSARIALTYYPTDLEALGPYLVQQILILLAPCAFIGQIYALLPKLAEWMHREDCLVLPMRKVLWIFVISDLVTLNLQSTGASVAGGSQGDKTQRDAGFYITMVGIVAQLVSLMIFCLVVGVFGYRVSLHPSGGSHEGGASTNDPFRPSTSRDELHRCKLPPAWKQLYGAIVWNCVGLLLRTAFRTAEYAEGDTGTVRIVEWYSYAFDVIPVFLSIITWTWIWPPHVLAPSGTRDDLHLLELQHLSHRLYRTMAYVIFPVLVA